MKALNKRTTPYFLRRLRLGLILVGVLFLIGFIEANTLWRVDGGDWNYTVPLGGGLALWGAAVGAFLITEDFANTHIPLLLSLGRTRRSCMQHSCILAVVAVVIETAAVVLLALLESLIMPMLYNGLECAFDMVTISLSHGPLITAAAAVIGILFGLVIHRLGTSALYGMLLLIGLFSWGFAFVCDDVVDLLIGGGGLYDLVFGCTDSAALSFSLFVAALAGILWVSWELLKRQE